MESTIANGKQLALHATLTGSRFEDVCLGDAEFDNVSLVRAKLSKVNLSDIRVSYFQMGGATFVTGGSHPDRGQKPITFQTCEMVATRFENCDLSNTKITGCKIEGMTIDGVLVTDRLEAFKSKYANTPPQDTRGPQPDR